MERLAKNCPFCGERISLEKPEPNVTATYYPPFVSSDGIKVYCCKCHSHGPAAVNEEEAIDKWNERISSNNDSCPFCGSNNLGDIRHLDSPTYAIICKKCSAYGPEGENIDDAKQKWDQRTLGGA
jgi:cytochrome c5